MTPTLETWLKQATSNLSKDSVARVRTEIEEHYGSAREAAIGAGVNEKEADRSALSALGDPKAANCAYRDVLLTSAEARMLREGKAEARIFCSRPWLKWSILAIPAGALCAAVSFFYSGDTAVAQVLLAGGLGISVFLSALFLPLYTRSRARVYRAVKWLALVGMLVVAFWPDTLRWSWLLFACLWPALSAEWTRMSLRRKLRVAEWPKHLYL